MLPFNLSKVRFGKKKTVNVSCCKVLVCSWRTFFCLFCLYDCLVVLSGLQIEAYLWLSSFHTLLHTSTDYVNIIVSGLWYSCLKPVQIIPVVIIRGTWGSVTCWDLGRYTGMLLLPLLQRLCFLSVMFLWTIFGEAWTSLWHWDEFVLCQERANLEEMRIWAGLLHHDTCCSTLSQSPGFCTENTSAWSHFGLTTQMRESIKQLMDKWDVSAMVYTSFQVWGVCALL